MVEAAVSWCLTSKGTRVMEITLTRVIIAVFIFKGIHGLQYSDCGSSKAVITSADVEDCPGNVCKLKKGTNATLHLSFKTEDVVEDLSVRLYGILMNHTMPYPGHYQKDGCQSDGVSCPVQPDTIQNYTLIIPVRKNFPKVPSVTIKLEINDIICIHIPGQVA